MGFHQEVVAPFIYYQVPTIELAKPTPKEAVCQVFEKVTVATGGDETGDLSSRTG